MPELRAGLQPLPEHMTGLPLEERGYPVPFFADTDPNTGKRDLRIMSSASLARCVKLDLCWVCGTKLTVARVFTLGTMGAINRINSEPPSHPDCARYAAVNCPFMSRGHMTYSAKTDIPPTSHADNGVSVNPGVWALYWSSGFSIELPGRGVHFHLKPPKMVEWWTQGRRATRQEVKEGVERAYAMLLPVAESEGMKADLDRHVHRLMPTLPRA